MASGKFKNKAFLQVILLALGLFLIFFVYFFDSKNDQEVEKKISTDQNFGKDDQNKNVFENLEYKGKDKNGNKFTIFSEYSNFNDQQPEIINMENIICYFYLREGVLEIWSQTAKYNYLTLDMSFLGNVNMIFKDNSLFSDKADFNNTNSSLIVEGNVKTLSPEGKILADKLNFDLIDKNLKISMNNEQEKVNIKTEIRWKKN